MYTFQVLDLEDKYKIINVLDPHIAMWISFGKTFSTDNADLFDFIYDKLEEGYSLYVLKSKDLSNLKIDDIEVVKENDLQQKISLLSIQALEKISQLLNIQTTESVIRYIDILFILLRKNLDESRLLEKDQIRLSKMQKLYELYSNYLELYDKMLMASSIEELDQIYQNFIGGIDEILQQSSLL